LAGKDIPSHLN